MTGRIEEFRNRLNACSETYVSQASAALATMQSELLAVKAAFEADIKADQDLYNAVAEDCLRLFDRRLKEAGLA
jgi:hypothetical protein